jgi:tetratricopeptide (TPR) repeat protein
MGEFRQTYSVGAGTADKKGRVQLTITIHPSRAARLYTARDRFTVPVRRLSIPQKARQELLNAQRRLQKKDLDGAVKHVDKALEMAPQYAAAWNMLGTIDYQRREFTKAEEHFREAKAQDPDMFEPVVNLGGVLLNLGKFDEALEFNLDAVKRRPKDALANAQLGMTYVELKQPLMGIKHLEETKRLDPGHYTYPQLHLSEIYWKLGNRLASVAEMEHFLRYHPDHEQAEKLRQTIRQVRERQANPAR